MAEATRTEKVITSTETVYTLKLTQEEFTHLMSVVGASRATDLNRAIYSALFSPKDVPAEDEAPQTFEYRDEVTVLPGAKSASGALVSTGPASIGSGLDSDGDYFVRFANGDADYVLARYLRKR